MKKNLEIKQVSAIHRYNFTGMQDITTMLDGNNFFLPRIFIAHHNLKYRWQILWVTPLQKSSESSGNYPNRYYGY